MPALRVAIVGAGLAGLTLARRLHHNGPNVTVFERDPDLITRNPGYGLHINSTGTTAIREVLDPRTHELFLATAGIPRQDALLFDEQLAPGPVRELTASRGTGNPNADAPEHLVVDRSTLRRILYTGLEETVRFGARVAGYQSHPDAIVTVHLIDGRTAEADVLVGADGINSAMRAQRLPDHSTVDLEARHIAAKIPLTEETRSRIPPQLYSTFTLVNGPHHDIVSFAPLERSNPHTPLVRERDPAFRDEVGNDFALGIFSARATRMPDDTQLYTSSPADLKPYALQRVASWHPDLITLVRLWDVDTVQPLTLRSHVPATAWEPTHVTVVGDAVHAMSPALGLGANTALRDAQVLGADCQSALSRPLPADDPKRRCVSLM
ncbi:FAD-dependent oxidoreductase [Streptomyces olivochromogenes]|uniref:FAD-dependent oxidoreductase n=1 Tax=Streptomyces olivochromogenes TaxID=1963 RepID=UPI001F1A539D|nr:NAD(P)/FAD-dependent oxidoreductase [Streptomyces olivochromogenes]MCF3134742.1 FAD-dependent monooxygenase [Streptomyces olivochromogenes]